MNKKDIIRLINTKVSEEFIEISDITVDELNMEVEDCFPCSINISVKANDKTYYVKAELTLRNK